MIGYHCVQLFYSFYWGRLLVFPVNLALLLSGLLCVAGQRRDEPRTNLLHSRVFLLLIALTLLIQLQDYKMWEVGR